MLSILENMAQRLREVRLAGEIAQLVEFLRRGWRLVAFSLVICLTLAAIYLASAERMYQATTRLLVLQHGARPLSVAAGDSGRLVEGADDFLPTHAVVIRSPMVVSRAIESIGLRNLPTLDRVRQSGRDPVQVAIDRLAVSRPDRTAKILHVAYQAGDRAEAIRTVEAIAEEYRAFLEDNYRSNSNQVVALISKARDELKGELEEAERKYIEFRQKNLVHSTDESGRSFLTRRLDYWDRAANEAMVREVQLRSQLELGKTLADSGTGLWAVAYALGQLGGEASNGPLAHAAAVSPSVASEYIRQLGQEQQRLAEKFGPEYARVKELQEQITRAQERMRDSRNRLDQVETRDLLTSIEESLKVIGAMRAEIARKFDSDLGAAKAAEADLMTEAKLRDGLERQRALFNSVVDQFKQAQLTSDFSSVSSQTIEPANALKSPVRPRLALTLLLSSLAGCVLGVAMVLVGERLGARIRTTEEIRRALGLNLLGQIPQLPKVAGEPVREAGLISHTMPRSPLSEAYKIVRTNLDLIRRSRRVQVVLVTSPHLGDGKSVTASNLAISIAHTGRRVLLIDADLRRPNQDWIHNLSRNQGLVHILKDLLPFHRVVHRSLIENLDIITAGPETPGPAELLSSGRLAEFFEQARQSYDLVIVDSPPLLAVADASIVGTLVDGILLVVRGDSLHQRDAQQVVESLQALETFAIGVVINRISAVKSPYVYGYGPTGDIPGLVDPDPEGEDTTPVGPAVGQTGAHSNGSPTPERDDDDFA